MGRKEKREGPFIIENVEIIDAGAEGKAIARYNDRVIFVPFVVPGDICDIRIVSKKRRFYEGRAIKFHQLSEQRTQPVCAHFGICGGCKWQNMLYERQLFYKQKQVIDNFSRIGHLDFPEVLPVIPSDNTEFYRNKLEYTFSCHRWLSEDEMGIAKEERDMDALGFHIPGMFDRVLDIEKCWLQPEPSNKIRLELKRFVKSRGFSFYDIRNFSGDLRGLIIRNSNTGDLMVLVVFGTEKFTVIEPVMEFMKTTFPEITSSFYIINQKKNDTIADLQAMLYSGQSYITEQMGDLKFRVGPLSFYQTNAHQALKLYEIASGFAALTGNEIVYDLYTGTGTIANFVAHNAAKVIGIEYVDSAVTDARLNAKINNIENVEFYAGDMAEILTEEFFKLHGQPEVVITDPPRAGMHEKVVKSLIAARPLRIVYVSCNPATQARDLSLLAHAYKINAVQPVDMFPHTQHVENVCLLTLRDASDIL
ncbi:23S rRNA (uracil-C(5))-methyltransferase RlmCD [anaerobic digester metagenome]